MILVVGAGLSGAVIARRFADDGFKVKVIEKREHIAGNCYDYVDEKTQILVNKYGAHLFHTNSERVWQWVCQFADWVRWDHEVKALVTVDGERKIVPMPVNITTVNTLLGKNIQNTKEMEHWLKENQLIFDSVENSQQMAESRIGVRLTELLVKDYTRKQWNKSPDELDASVLARIPVRADFDTRYFSDKYQGLPLNGYTDFVFRILDHENIEVELNVDFFDMANIHNEFHSKNFPCDQFQNVIYTGPIDRYFESAGMEPLEYRSLRLN